MTIARKDLALAIENQDLRLHYQPIVCPRSSRVLGVEALVRWQHPSEGLVAPDHFIGVAEALDLIVPLGNWVLRQACIDARQWPDLRVAVNVSPLQIRQGDFSATVAAILAETGFDAHRLELEITEATALDNDATSHDAIASLRRIGIRFALDDFGMGYSGLMTLRRFPFDKIKIDRAFMDMSDGEGGDATIILDFIIRLGTALGLTVTAEGVEARDQQDRLVEAGCDELQGFLFAMPMSATDLGLFLAGAPTIGTA
ncbi:EAL domain-containing protein [Lichenihabitans sp. PAMC28606]|uniref:putative bifunctional diguanylate cyclase/phosphodiesterase n=1 Tax=Lichenihabitans sp. PAMC28606 TaxID=2880932 RepID=UPI001D0B36B6|nr:EAL domain-containing protein [Lichenihabitans sp. PAMC28606]UDL94686.1 EAL domain-containing protein [Lichenihabitans sp. PAMC28606]